MKRVRRYPIKLSSLPKTRSLFRLMQVGPVTRVSSVNGVSTRDTEPLWQAVFQEQSMPEPGELDYRAQIIRCNVPASNLHYMLLASLWSEQSLSIPSGRGRLQKVKINAESQSLLWRKDSSANYQFFEQRQKDAVPYVYIASHDSSLDGVVVRCSEIIRFYFGPSGHLLKYMFDFANGVEHNDALFDASRTHWINEDTFLISPADKIRDDKEANFIAAQISYAPSRYSLAKIASSARDLQIAGQPVWPEATVPIDGISTWNVIGVIRNIEIVAFGGSRKKVNVLGIASIVQCNAQPKWPNIQILRPSTSKRPPTVTDADRIPTPGGVKESAIIVSDQVSSGSIRVDMRPMQDISSARPQLIQQSPTVITSYEGNRNDAVITVAAVQEPVHELSAIEGAGGDDRVGAISTVPDGKEPTRKGNSANQNEIDPLERSNLPTLFRPFEHELLQRVTTSIDQLPDAFKPIVRAGQIIADRKKIGEEQWFVDLWTNAEHTSVELLDLPESWGANVHCPDSPTGCRRTLSMFIRFADIEACVLDIEPRRPGEIAAYCILTTRPNSITTNLISSIVHWRLFSKSNEIETGGGTKHGKSKGWPDRESHSGNFWSHSFRHKYAQEAEIYMFNRITTHLKWLYKSAHSLHS